MTAGAKTTEFWVVAAFVADYFLQQFGIYQGLTQEQVLSTAEQVQQIANQLKGKTGSDSGNLYLLAGIYVAARAALKWKKAEPA